LQVGTKAVAMDTKVTLAAPTGHAVDKWRRARSVWVGHPVTPRRGVCSGQWRSEQPGEALRAQGTAAGCCTSTNHGDPCDHCIASLPENSIVMGASW